MVFYGIPGDCEINRGLVGYWKLDDKKAGTGVTKSIDRANFNDGTISGAVNATGFNGLNADAMSFDGVDDYVEVAHDASQLCYTTGGFTISAWVNITGDGEVVGGISSGRILDKSQLSFAIRGANKNFYLSVNGGTTKGQSTNNTALPYGVWKHVLVYYLPADTRAYFYINGVFDRAWGAGTPVSNSGVMRIGNAASSTDNTFDGSIANVRIYNRVLSSGEISKLYRLKL
jgi:hypothetical protein